MAFSDETIEDAWRRAEGKCECRRSSHDHSYHRCDKWLVREDRGRETGTGAWEAHHVSISGGDTFSNCEILCWDCHKKTL